MICPNCGEEMDDEVAAQGLCDHCGKEFDLNDVEKEDILSGGYESEKDEKKDETMKPKTNLTISLRTKIRISSAIMMVDKAVPLV